MQVHTVTEVIDERWLVVCEVAQRDDGPVITRLSITPRTGLADGEGITAALLRRVPLGTVQRRILLQTEGGKAATIPQHTKRVGHPLNATHYRRTWKRYLELLRENRADYAKVIAAEFGINRSTVRTHIKRAKKLYNTNVSPTPASLGLTGPAPTLLIAPTKRR